MLQGLYMKAGIVKDDIKFTLETDIYLKLCRCSVNSAIQPAKWQSKMSVACKTGSTRVESKL